MLPAYGHPPLICGRHRLALDRPRVMGVINVTPDSFYDGGRFAEPAAALARARALLADGADIIDIGGESTRPSATPTPDAEELARVIPLIERLREGCDERGVPISVDTRKPAVMRAAIGAGASMINDISALRAAGAVEAVAGSGVQVAVCLMHMRGDPQTMQQAAVYSDVVAEVTSFLNARVAACVTAGIARERIVVDPGFGFGKTVEHNLTLLRRLEAIVALGYPILVGLSRKSTIGALTGRDVGARMAGSVAAALAAVARGATIVRTHDVRETVDALKVWQAIN
ncbi:MAG: dihydropteroate synthase [Casimicrobiaceae bacterium]